MVIVCGVSQLPLVNVNVAGDTVASPVSDEATDKTTSVRGPLVRTTVNVSVEPVSATVVEPPDSVTVNPAVSLSVVETDTV